MLRSLHILVTTVVLEVANSCLQVAFNFLKLICTQYLIIVLSTKSVKLLFSLSKFRVKQNMTQPSISHHVEHNLHSLAKFSHYLTENACHVTSLLGSTILIGGILMALLNIIATLINLTFESKLPMLYTISYNDNSKKKLATFGRVRQQLGEITALGKITIFKAKYFVFTTILQGWRCWLFLMSWKH